MLLFIQSIYIYIYVSQKIILKHSYASELNGLLALKKSFDIQESIYLFIKYIYFDIVYYGYININCSYL